MAEAAHALSHASTRAVLCMWGDSIAVPVTPCVIRSHGARVARKRWNVVDCFVWKIFCAHRVSARASELSLLVRQSVMPSLEEAELKAAVAGFLREPRNGTSLPWALVESLRLWRCSSWARSQ